MTLIRTLPLLLVLICITLVGCAPLPTTDSLSALTERDEGISLFEERSWNELDDRDLTDDERLVLRDLPSTVEESNFVRRESVAKKIKHGFEKVGKGIKNAAKKVGEGVKKAATKVGEGVKTAAKKVGEGVKTAAKKTGEGVKTAAKKVGQFAKNTGAKVAKFGLEVYSTAQSVASKAAKFIPGVGKPISAGLEAASKVTGLAADKIPAKLPPKLEKGYKVMEKIKDPVGGAAGAVINALRRGIDESEFLFERDFVDSEDDLYVRSEDELDLFARFEEDDFFRREYD